MIRRGDIVEVRTYITRRKTKAVVQYVNYPFGWYTAMVKTPWGHRYNETFWIRDMDEKLAQEGKKNSKDTSGWDEEDNPDNWLSEWGEGRYNG